MGFREMLGMKPAAPKIDWEAKFKAAAIDLEAQTTGIAARDAEIAALSDEMATIDAELAALRPDAEAMRKKRRDDVARVQAKRDAARRVARPLTAPTKAVAVKGKAK